MTGVNIPLLDVKKLAYFLVNGYWQVSVIDEIDSTQNYLKAKSINDLQHGQVLAAEFQSAGRGRLDRKFEADKSASLLFSLYLEPQRPRNDWGWIPLLAGLAVTKTLNSQENYFATKWPNDVLAVDSPADGKVSGILVETHNNGVIVGIGINVGMSKTELPVPTATSLALLGIKELDRNIYLAKILEVFAHLLARWESGEDLTSEYLELSSTIGKKVEIHHTDGEIESGQAVGIGLHGELILDDGRFIYSGDVIHLYT
jgi:BirA family biotin operon repressor/biotin-[acetyl-CoA-carboxylase] ligase